MAPATANDSTSKPNSCRIEDPRNRKTIIITPETIVALPDSTCPIFLRKAITMGIDPKISIIENRINVTEKISLMLNMSQNSARESRICYSAISVKNQKG